MDLLKAIQNYVTKMVTQVHGIKVLLLDSDTTPIISLAATQSSLLSHEIYLTDSVSNSSRERMSHLKCICFLRPTEESLQALEAELRSPRYGEYWLYFSNVLKKSEIERLAEADEHEVVREVQEFFADFAPITTSHFSLNINPAPPSAAPSTLSLTALMAQAPPRRDERYSALYGDSPNSWNTASGALNRHVEGLMALLLSLKKKPVVRYERMSGMGKKLGQEILYQMQAESQLFDFRPTHPPPILLILDRRNDPVTPLLSQWTYQAMVHELLGISNGRVDLSSSPDVRPETKEIVLSPEQDPFFSQNLYANFGDLGAHIKGYVSEYQTRAASSQMQANGIETVADMKRFLENYPEHRKLGGNVSKHVALVGELSRLVGQLKLLEVSELEQSLASNESHSSDLKNVQQMILSEAIAPEAKLRLAILYALRYQKFSGNAILAVVDLLAANGISEADASLVHVMLNFAGADQRQDDLFANSNFFSRGKSALKGLKGVENVYTQHTPHLAETVEALLKGKLKEASYPVLEGQSGSVGGGGGGGGGSGGSGGAQSGVVGLRPTEVIVFMVGGTTYEEARTIALMDEKLASGQGLGGQGAQPQQGARVVLGGTCIHNSKSFLDMVRDAASRFPASAAAASLALRTQAAQQAAGQTGGLNLQLGNLSVNVGANGAVAGAGGALEEIGDAARDSVRNLLGRVRKGVGSL